MRERWVSEDVIKDLVWEGPNTRWKLKMPEVFDSKPIVEELLTKNVISKVHIPFNMRLFTLKYREVMPALRLLKSQHKIEYSPLNHKILADQVRTTLYALDCWEKIHTVNDQDGNERYINYQEAKRELEEHGKEAGFDVAEYFEYNDYVNSLEQNVFQWATKNMSVLQLKHSFKDKKGITTTMASYMFDSGYATLKVLRDRGCTLPFEVFYLGEYDLSYSYRQKLSALGNTTLIDLTAYIDVDVFGWACKPFIMLFSSFREVVFMDSDSLFLQPAERLFKQPIYIKHGALFFLDRSVEKGRESDVIAWMDQLMPGNTYTSSQKVMHSRYMHGFTSHEQESGVVVIDKGRHFSSLLAVCQLNLEMERSVTYSMIHGDKETFWLGFEMVGDSNWAFSPFTPGVMGRKQVNLNARDQDTYSYRICSSKIVHLDCNGNPFWFNGGILRSKFVSDEEKRFEDFTYWSVEPGYWEFFGHHVACLHSPIEPMRIENDSYIASWLASHRKAFREVAPDSPLIQNSTLLVAM